MMKIFSRNSSQGRVRARGSGDQAPRRTLRLLVLLALAGLMPSACSHHPPPPPSASPAAQEAAGPKADETRQKTRQPPPAETVTINGKTYPVPAPWAGNRLVAPEFVPSDFRRIPPAYTYQGSKLYILAPAHGPLLDLLSRAEEEGISLRVHSAYRSKRYQRQIFKRMLEEGRTFADIVRYVAPPGYSEHMFGMSVDFYPSNWQFADTPAYAWLQENASRFGFRETYPQTNPLHIPWEAWHWTYAGAGEGGMQPRLAPAKTKKAAAPAGR